MTDLGKAESVSYNVSSAVESLARSQATSIPISMSRGVKYGTRQNREALLQSEQQSVSERSGRGHARQIPVSMSESQHSAQRASSTVAEATRNSGQHERVAELTARGRLYEHSFGYLCTYSRDLQVFFRTVSRARFFSYEGTKIVSHFGT